MRRTIVTLGIVALATVLMANQQARAELTVLGQFDPDQGTLVSAGFDSATDSVWIYGSSDADLRRYSRDGSFLSFIPQPGEAANDADIAFAPVAFTLGTTPVPAGSLLFINGETGTADIYAVDKGTGMVIASLATAFGVNHVIGGSYHPGRGTFFLAADRLDSANPNTIAEINPVTGAVLNTFGTGSADYTINFGDLEVSPSTGNLMLVSSSENRLRVLTPEGGIVEDLTLPAGVSSLSGIGLDDLRGELWVSGTGGNVWRLFSEAPPVHDLAVTKITAPATITLTNNKPQLTKPVTVQIQNRSPHDETIPDLATLGNLVILTVTSRGSCLSPSQELQDPGLPKTLQPKKTLNVVFGVTFDCANDPAKGAGHEDYDYSASADHVALDGEADTHPEDDSCPRTPLGIDPNPDGKINDKGCVEKVTDVVDKRTIAVQETP